jgi:23S rRNA U2552 (ribose-2'-O)-methylase RlmE/FtsJ
VRIFRPESTRKGSTEVFVVGVGRRDPAAKEA